MIATGVQIPLETPVHSRTDSSIARSGRAVSAHEQVLVCMHTGRWYAQRDVCRYCMVLDGTMLSIYIQLDRC